MTKQTVRLKVIPEPAPNTRAVFVKDPFGASGPFMRGPDPTAPDICCGSCGEPLVAAMPRRSLQNMVFKCFKCGAFNDAIDTTVN